MSKLVENKKEIAKLIVKDILSHPLILDSHLTSDIEALYYLLTQEDDFLKMNEKNYKYFLDIFELSGNMK